MKGQPANISPLWFFTKLGIICVLGVFVFAQVYLLLWDVKSTVPQISPLVTPVTEVPDDISTKQWDVTVNPPGTIAPPVMSEQTPLRTRAQVRRELAEMVKKGLKKTITKPVKMPLSEALVDAKTYDLIKSGIIHNLDGPYGKLYRNLGLDDDKLQELRGLLADKELGIVEGYTLAQETKTSLSSDSLNSLRNEPDEAIRNLLGDDAFAYYKEYESTLGARNHADAFEKLLSYKTEPLTGDQYNALVSALAALPDPNIKPDSGAWMGSYTPSISKESLGIVKDILTSSQYAVYEALYETAQINRALAEQHSKQSGNAAEKQRAENKAKTSKGGKAP